MRTVLIASIVCIIASAIHESFQDNVAVGIRSKQNRKI